MALLAFLGRELTNKVPADLYQRHRDTETWTWKADGPTIAYRIDEIRSADPKKVAVVLSLSGKIDINRLPEDIRKSYSVYEITLDGTVPTTTFLRTRRDLEGFRIAYQELLALIAAKHGHLESTSMSSQRFLPRRRAVGSRAASAGAPTTAIL